ncbi:hypothetical protein ACA910_004565 [Epithemia clementina (nom. ined.)]
MTLMPNLFHMPILLPVALLLLLVQESVGFLSIETRQHQCSGNAPSSFYWSSLKASSSSSSTDSSKMSSLPSSSEAPLFLLNAFLTSSPATATGSSPSSSSSTVLSLSSWAVTNECDDVNLPPSLNILLRTLQQLTRAGSSTDIRGRFVDHKRVGSVASVAYQIGRSSQASSTYAPLTPFAAYCLGYGFAQHVLDQQQRQTRQTTAAATKTEQEPITIVVGQDPRPHGMRLVDAFARGAEQAGRPPQQRMPEPEPQSEPAPLVQVLYTGIATTPACAAFSGFLTKATASVMVTASHLPIDRNGFKFFYQGNCLTKAEIGLVGHWASQFAIQWYTQNSLLPPSSGEGAVMCTSWVDYMPEYAASLKRAIQREVEDPSNNSNADNKSDPDKCLEGLTLVVNAGHGSGGFFQGVLKDLGANVIGSIGITPDEKFPLGIPNPEYQPMMDATIKACQNVQADLGIMLDTDSDRCGFVVPTTKTAADHAIQYEPLNRNRLIAMMGVILSQTDNGRGRCGIVTDSVTSEGLSTFLQDNLGLTHVRYLKGYQNVIDKAKELTETGVLNVELAMETSGHGAMKENNYLDDGTYTAVKVVGLLARQRRRQGHVGSDDNNNKKVSLLDLIAEMKELDVIRELRFKVLDDSLDTMQQVFDFCALEIENLCLNNPDKESVTDDDEDDDSNNNNNDAHDTNAAAAAPQVHSYWSLDVDNLEGIRVRVGGGQFFMLRKSLHDPIISLQVEASSDTEARRLVIDPLLELLDSEEAIRSQLDLSVLRDF